MSSLDIIQQVNQNRIGTILNSFQKAYVEGVYGDSLLNRKLGRVGNKYGAVAEVKKEELNKMQILRLFSIAKDVKSMHFIPLNKLIKLQQLGYLKAHPDPQSSFATPFILSQKGEKYVKENKEFQKQVKLTPFENLENLVNKHKYIKITMKKGRKFYMDKEVVNYNKKFAKLTNQFYADKEVGDEATGSGNLPKIKTEAFSGDRPPGIEKVFYKDIEKIEPDNSYYYRFT